MRAYVCTECKHMFALNDREVRDIKERTSEDHIECPDDDCLGRLEELTTPVGFADSDDEET
jgi:DNA-directed RNA polymerase subunit RPC12/RpoP